MANTDEAGITECRNAIRQIERQIDTVLAELCALESIKPLSSASWQHAWDRHPHLRQREKQLYIRRANVGEQLCAAERRVATRWSAPKPPKCKSCGGSGYAKRVSA